METAKKRIFWLDKLNQAVYLHPLVQQACLICPDIYSYGGCIFIG